MDSKITDRDIDDFYAAFCPWGYRDIKVALETSRAAGKNKDFAIEVIQEYKESTGMTDNANIDPVYCVYDALHQEARQEIESATGKDICNDEPYSGVYVAGNYMCTSIDCSTKAAKALHELIATMDEPSKVVEWLRSEVNF